MRRLVRVVAAGAAASLVACSGAPSGDAPDYEMGTPPPTEPPPAAGHGGSSPVADAATGTPDTPSRDAGDEDDAATTEPVEGSSVTVDGVALTVGDVRLWSELQGPGIYDLFVRVTGPNVPAGSDLHVSARASGTGCDVTKNTIFYRVARPGSPATVYEPNGGAPAAACGLSVTEVPTAVGGRFTGTFQGTLTVRGTGASRNVVATFDKVRAK